MQVQTKLMLLVADPRNIGRLCELLGSMPNIDFPTNGGPFVGMTYPLIRGGDYNQTKVYY